MNESSTNQEQTCTKTRQEIVMEALNEIPKVEKREIYGQSFPPFEFSCWGCSYPAHSLEGGNKFRNKFDINSF